MAVAFDNATQDTGTGSRTFNHTITGSDVGLILFVVSGGADTVTVTGITYDGVSMSFIREEVNPGGDAEHAEVWQLAAPATGTNEVVVTITGTPNDVTAIAMSFTGTNQTTLVSNDNGGTGDGDPLSTTVTSATGRMVADAAATERDKDGWTVGAGQTLRTQSASERPRASTSTEPGASSVAMSWDNVSSTWAHVVVDIDEAADQQARRVMVIT